MALGNSDLHRAKWLFVLFSPGLTMPGKIPSNGLLETAHGSVWQKIAGRRLTGVTKLFDLKTLHVWRKNVIYNLAILYGGPRNLATELHFESALERRLVQQSASSCGMW